MGSSNKSRSGLDSSKRHRATRRCSPPESFVTSVPKGGNLSVSIAISKVRSRSHAPAACILSCRSACSTRRDSRSASGSPKEAHTSLNRSTRASRLGDPVRDVAEHVLGRIKLGFWSRRNPYRRSPGSAAPRR